MGPDGFVGINWGSSNFRAYRVDADGSIRDERTAPAGVAMLDREGMARVLSDALVGWEDCSARYATGMIGSNIGWTAVPYVDCPASMADLSHALVEARIGAHEILIVPGLACTRVDDVPDILRGEEMELFGALACTKGDEAPRHVVLPGTHTKWVSLADGAVRTFMTAMSGELYDRMTSAGLLASVVSGAGNADLLAAIRPVLPSDVRIAAVGGVGIANAADWLDAGAHAIGVGSELYRPGRGVDDIAARAKSLVMAATRKKAAAHVVARGTAMIAESPVVIGGPDRLLWVEPIERRLNSLSLAGGAVTSVTLEHALWSLVVTPDGQLYGCSADGVGAVDPVTGTIAPMADVRVGEGMRLNDMTCDRRGGVWIGAMHMGLLAGRGSLHYLAPEEASAASVVATGLGVPNGMAFSRDQQTLFVIDTTERSLLAFPADIRTGVLGQPKIVTDFAGIPGKPDGLAVDRDGNSWVAMWGGGCICCISPDGKERRRIPIGATNVSSLCLIEGQDNGAASRAYVSTSRARIGNADIEQPEAGSIFEVVINDG